MYVHIQTQWPQNSVAIKHMCKQCIPGALSPPFSSVPGYEAMLQLETIVVDGNETQVHNATYINTRQLATTSRRVEGGFLKASSPLERFQATQRKL